MTKRITSRMIAERAGVSPATVSLVLRNRPGIGAQTREHVLAVARDLGFEADPPVESRKTGNLMLVVYKQHGRVVAETPFFTHLIKGVSDAAYSMGYHRMAISYFYAQQNHAEQLHAIRSHHCSGIVLLATEMSVKDIKPFERLGVPIVLLDNWFPTKSLDSVVIDNMRGAWEAVRYLSNKGHKEIGYLHSQTQIRNFLERREGFISAIRDFGTIEVGPSHFIVSVGSTDEAAYEDMCTYLDENPWLPTAFFADNDLIAASCIRALTQYGYAVPDDVSVMGFDDVETSAKLVPPLTTMAVAKQSMGSLAVRRLVDRMNGITDGEIVRISVKPSIVERASVITPSNSSANYSEEDGQEGR